MTVSANLDGFPPVIRVNVSQPSGSKPGRIVVDTLVSAEAPTNWQDSTTLSINYNGSTFTWTFIRAVKAPRIRRGYMRTVFEDSRWMLRRVTFGESYNVRDGLGNLLADNQKTVAELMTIIATAGGFTVASGAILPSYKPAADWRGLTGEQALENLLKNAVCRLVYNPLTATYKLWAAGAGPLPDVSKRMYGPGPNRSIWKIEAVSAPTLYEARLEANAVVDNAAGELEPLANYDDGDGYFDEFVDYAGTDPLRSRLIATAFRLWLITNTVNKQILPHRAMPILPDGYASAKAIRGPLQSQMRQHPVFPFGGNSELATINGGKVFVSDDPILDSNGASLVTIAYILVAYYVLSSGVPTRTVASRTIGTGTSVRKFVFDWIKPISSAEPDIGTQSWTDLLDDVADALQQMFENPTGNLTLPGLPQFAESGHIGAAQYTLSVYPTTKAITRLALDYDPKNWTF